MSFLKKQITLVLAFLAFVTFVVFDLSLISGAWANPSVPSVIVAIIDTGIDPNHTQLTQEIWKDPESKETLIYGWNFVTNRPNPKDENGHGTHISGIIRSVVYPKHSKFAFPRKVSLMPLKYYAEGSVGSINLEHSVKAIYYAIDHGAKIINYSGGGPGFSREEFLAIQKAQAHGVLIVAAAGNEKQDTDLEENFYYPSAYRAHGLTNIISVAATDQNNKLLTSSNWGHKNVDVAAPGEKIYSTLPNNRYGTMSGTSQATAFVSGVAAMLLAKNPRLTPQKLRELIMSSVDLSNALKGKVSSGGHVNPLKAALGFRDDLLVHSSLSWLAQQPTFLQEIVKIP